MFETSSLLPMLGMAAQMKGAVQGRNAAQGLPLGLQSEVGLGLQLPQTADPNGSLFQLMLGIALPQAGAPSARPASARQVSDSEGDSTNQSIALPFTSDELEAGGEEQNVTASAMMPFYPVMWNAAPAAPAATPADAAKAGERIPGPTLEPVMGSQNVVPGTETAAAAYADVAHATAGKSEMQTVAGTANAAKAVNDPAIAAALEMMAPVADAGTTDGKIAADAAPQTVAAAARPDMSTAAVSTAAVPTAAVSPAADSTTAGSAEAVEAVNDPALGAALAEALPFTDAGIVGTKSTSDASAHTAAVATRPNTNPAATKADAAADMTVSAKTPKSADPAAVSAAGVENTIIENRPAKVDVNNPDAAQAVPANIAHDIERSAVSPEARVSQNAAQTVPVRETSTEQSVVAAPRKQTAALAWAESTLRRHTRAHLRQGTAQTASPALAEIKAGAVGSASVNAPQRIVEPAAVKTAVENAAAVNPVADAAAVISSAAPAAQVYVHEAVMAAAAPDVMKTNVKTTRATAAAAPAVPTADESVVARQAPEATIEGTEVPASAAARKAERTEVREEAPARSASDAPAEIRPVKADGAQQPLANVQDAQRQTAPVSETKTVMTTRAREEVFEQVYREVSSIRHTPGSVDVTLTPESLGRVNIKVGLEDGKMAARIDVQNADVKHIVEANMPRLHEALQQNGITLDSVAVFVNTGSSFAEKRNDAPKKKVNGSSPSIDDGFEPLGAAGDAKHYGYNTVEYIM